MLRLHQLLPKFRVRCTECALGPSGAGDLGMLDASSMLASAGAKVVGAHSRSPT